MRRAYVGGENKKETEDIKKEEDSAASSQSGMRNGAHLTHTGRLGEVMKESVEVVKVAVFNFLV